MRVFESFIYNLKDIKFKDTKVYFDDLLETLKLNYSGIIFCFNADSAGNNCKKVIKNFPQLEEYTQYLKESDRYFKSAPDYCLCSIKKDKDGNIVKHMNPNHEDDLDALLKKIPNPINFGFMGVVLDNINWFDTDIQNPIFYSNSQNIDYYNHRFNKYFSNSIRFFKEFDFGNKLNLVEVVIEREIAKEKLKAYPISFSKLLSMLGKPISSRLEFVFTDDEKITWLNSSKKFKQILERKNKNKFKFSSYEPLENPESYLIDLITPIKGFSPKTAFNKIAEVKGYTYRSCNNGCYEYQYINSNNHIFKMELVGIPFSSLFNASIRVEGYNFKHTLFITPQYSIKNPVDAESFAKIFFDKSEELINEYSEELLFLFGKTPNWYIGNK